LSFTSRKDLNRHGRSIHSKSVVFFCSVEGCRRQKEGWSRRDNYIRHMRQVHGVNIEANGKRGSRSPPLAARSLLDNLAPMGTGNRRKRAASGQTTRESSEEGRPEKRLKVSPTVDDNRDARIAELTAQVQALQEQLQKKEQETQALQEKYERRQDTLLEVITDLRSRKQGGFEGAIEHGTLI